MKYIKRAIEPYLEKARKTFKSVLITGPRQVGKSTLLKHSLPEIPLITFDNKLLLRAAQNDPTLFLKDNPAPLILDEIQYAPELFPEIKMICDSTDKKGNFIMTGSQQFNLMKNVSESLVGRIAILSLQGLSLREKNNISFNKQFVPTDEYFNERKQEYVKYDDLWYHIHRGSNPELMDKDVDWTMFWSAYVQTYIERDVSQLINIKDKSTFLTFMISLAARSGQLLNYSAIANEVGKNAGTIKEWISVLEASGIIFLIQPYSSSVLNRAIKTPKVYFHDTGLVSYLTRYLTPDNLRLGAMNGNIFETFVISEILKSFSNEGKEYQFGVFYYRGKDKRRIKIDGVQEQLEQEIDLIISENDTLYPIEIKISANPNPAMARAFDVLDLDKSKKRGKGSIICLSDHLMHLEENLLVVPIEYI